MAQVRVTNHSGFMVAVCSGSGGGVADELRFVVSAVGIGCVSIGPQQRGKEVVETCVVC